MNIPATYLSREHLGYVLEALHHMRYRIIDIEAAAVAVLQINDQRIEAVLEAPARVAALRVKAVNEKCFRIAFSGLPHHNIYVEEAAGGMLSSSNASVALAHALHDVIAERSSTPKGPTP